MRKDLGDSLAHTLRDQFFWVVRAKRQKKKRMSCDPSSCMPEDRGTATKRRRDESAKRLECAEEGCVARPTFNVEGERGLAFARRTRREGTERTSRTSGVREEGCSAQPVFNIEGERPRFCKAHKTEGMVDVVANDARKTGAALSQALIFQASRGSLCKAHKTEGMVDVVSKRCAQDGCSAQPSFNSGRESSLLQGAQDRRHGECQTQAVCKEVQCSAGLQRRGRDRPRFCKAHKTRRHGSTSRTSGVRRRVQCSADLQQRGRDRPRFCKAHKTRRHGGRHKQAQCAPRRVQMLGRPLNNKGEGLAFARRTRRKAW